eukprot:SAG22_NODE_20321_length_266_cov_1.239521_1_plen_26_part_10
MEEQRADGFGGAAGRPAAQRLRGMLG